MKRETKVPNKLVIDNAELLPLKKENTIGQRVKKRLL